MKKRNLKVNIALELTIVLFFIPLIFSIPVMKEKPQIKVDVPNHLNISQAEIFNGMIVNYTFDDYGTVYNSGFSYEYDSGSNYNVSWWIDGWDFNRWVEDETNRLISMSSGDYSFDVGTHAPIWIFTNVSLYDLVPIAVDGEVDHTFNVTKEKIFNIPGFGSVEVWELEDLSHPGGIAWYEKSTGTLMEGYFLYSTRYYTLEFYNTNAVFNNVQPLSGLFDGLYMNYNFSVGIDLPVNVSYAGYSVNTYNTTMNVTSFGSGYWTEDTTTRIMSYVDSGGPNFLPGLYTPYWIFTNVSIGVNVSITVDGEGDHIFQVKRSVNIEYPGFGPISVWELEDLDGLGGILWYEKNSGILVNGTFIYTSGPPGFYGFTLLETNAIFAFLLPFPFNLLKNATTPDTDGIFDLEWTNSEFAENYSLYEYSSYITEFNSSLTPVILETNEMTHHFSEYTTGEYYFIAIAKNDFGMTLSNCVKITVAIPSSSKGIPGYSIFFLLLATLSITMIMLKKWKNMV